MRKRVAAALYVLSYWINRQSVILNMRLQSLSLWIGNRAFDVRYPDFLERLKDDE